MLVQEGATASAGGLLGGGEARQRDHLDGVLLLTTAVSVQGVVELRPVPSFVQFVFFGHGPAQGVATIHDSHGDQVGFGSPGEALLQTKGRHRAGDGGGGRGGGRAVVTGILELGQGWGHPAAVRVSQYQTLLGAGLGGLGQGFLQVHLNGCEREKEQENIVNQSRRNLRTSAAGTAAASPGCRRSTS